jgi:hypothetical protein
MIKKSQALRIICFLLVLAFTDQITGLVLRKLYFSQKAGQNANLNYSFQKCKADILIFGNSRAQHHYDSRILSDCLNLSCYNAGIDGGHSILLPYAQIKVITERYLPKIIILEFKPTGVVHYEGDYDRLSVLLPYYDEYPELRKLILLRSPAEKIKLFSAIYPFNSDIIDILRFNTNYRSITKYDFNGYIPLKSDALNIGKSKTQPQKQVQSIVDTNMIIALKNIISLCKEKNITLYILNSPSFHNLNEIQSPPSPIAKMTLDIIYQNKVNFLDFSFDTNFIGKVDLFKDMEHLNDKGATKYSLIIADILKKNNAGKTNLHLTSMRHVVGQH